MQKRRELHLEKRDVDIEVYWLGRNDSWRTRKRGLWGLTRGGGGVWGVVGTEGNLFPWKGLFERKDFAWDPRDREEANLMKREGVAEK